MELQTGIFESTLDDKGRIGIPARLRSNYEGDLIISQGTQSCVWIMRHDQWERINERLFQKARVLSEPERQRLKYQYGYSGQTVEIDKSGRIAVPSALRKHTGLSRDCVVLSADRHLEIWDAGTYQTFMQEIRLSNEKLMKKLGTIDLFGDDET